MNCLYGTAWNVNVSMKCLYNRISQAQSDVFNRLSLSHEREPQPEAAVSFRTVVTFATWLISTKEFFNGIAPCSGCIRLLNDSKYPRH